MSRLCVGCGVELSDCGPIGLACLNKDCTYEWDMALAGLKRRKREEELKELARLKAKYEGGDE